MPVWASEDYEEVSSKAMPNKLKAERADKRVGGLVKQLEEETRRMIPCVYNVDSNSTLLSC